MERWPVDAPNPKTDIEKIRAAFMDEWVAMNDHRGTPDFNTRVASYKHFGYPPLGIVGDQRWGLNGKRGGDDISPDVLNFRNPKAPWGTESYDYVIGHGGGASATVGWIDVGRDAEGYDQTGHKHDEPGAGAKWIQPPHPSTLDGGVEPPQQPPSSDLQKQVEALLSKVGAMDKRLSEVERRPPAADINGKRIALMSAHGTYLCADANQGEPVEPDPDANEDARNIPVLANRRGAGGWEVFTIAEVK